MASHLRDLGTWGMRIKRLRFGMPRVLLSRQMLVSRQSRYLETTTAVDDVGHLVLMYVPRPWTEYRPVPTFMTGDVS